MKLHCYNRIQPVLSDNLGLFPYLLLIACTTFDDLISSSRKRIQLLTLPWEQSEGWRKKNFPPSKREKKSQMYSLVVLLCTKEEMNNNLLSHGVKTFFAIWKLEKRTRNMTIF